MTNRPPPSIRTARRSRRARLLLAAGFAAAALLQSPTAGAQGAYPNKPIRIVVPFAPGGATDLLSRMFGQKLGEAWGQPVLVENKPGAGGNIGAEQVARAAPDGYTLLMSAAGFMAVNPSLYPNLPFDPARDFTPLTLLVKAPLLLVVHDKVPAKDVKSFVELVRRSPGKITFGNGGNGTAQHLGGVYMATEAGLDVLHVPYKGSAPATNDLLAGVFDAQFDNMVTLIPYVTSGRLRALAVSGKERSPSLPDVPTLAETVLPGFETGTWYGFVGPAGMPEPIARKLATEMQRILQQPDIQAKLASMGLIPAGTSGDAFGGFIRDEITRYARIVKAAGVKLE